MPAAAPEASIRARPYFPERTPAARTPATAQMPPSILCMLHPKTRDNVPSGHDAHHPAVFDYRQAVDPVAGHDARRLLDRVVRSYLMQIPAHHLGNLLRSYILQTRLHLLPLHQIAERHL